MDMEKLLKRNVWIEFGLSVLLLLLFSILAVFGEVWIEEAIPGTIPASFFPFLISCLLSVLCFILVINSFRGLWAMYSGTGDKEQKSLEQSAQASGRFLALFAYVGILFLYLIGLDYVGFVYSTPFVMLLISLLLGIKRWIIGFACYCVFAYALDWAALNLMQIILPQGSLWQ